MEENKTKKEQEQPQNVVSTRKWLYYPLLLISFFVIFVVAVLLGEMFERNSTFTHGLAGIGVMFVWGAREGLKGACSKDVGFTPMIMYWGMILAYCGFLLSVSAFGIILGTIIAVAVFALLYFVVPALLNNKTKIILFLLLLSASLANAKKLHFDGIPIEGNVVTIYSKLKAKGCTDIKKEKMFYLMKGRYMGETAYYELSYNPTNNRVLYLSIYLSQPSDAAAAGMKAMKIMKHLQPVYGNFDSYGSYWGVQLEDGGVCVNSQKQMGKMMIKVSFIRDELATGYINGEYDKYIK